MNIELLYRISSHNQIIEVDDVSTSLDKVSKKVAFIESSLPSIEDLGSTLRNMSVGTIVIVDSFNNKNHNIFDAFSGAENDLKIHSIEQVGKQKVLICQPNSFLTFYMGQVLEHEPKVFRAKIITLSDRAHRGIYEDRSGPRVEELLQEHFKSLNKTIEIESVIIPDDRETFIEHIVEVRDGKFDVLITTGGTGVGKRDITVDTLEIFVCKPIPGIMEMIRLKYGQNNPKALLSRGIAGVMNETLVYSLPGSVKAVNEYLSEIFLTLDHLFYMINGVDNH